MYDLTKTVDGRSHPSNALDWHTDSLKNYLTHFKLLYTIYFLKCLLQSTKRYGFHEMTFCHQPQQ